MALESKIKRLTEVRQFVNELEDKDNTRVSLDTVTFLENGCVDTIEDGKVIVNGSTVGYFSLTGNATPTFDNRRLNINIDYANVDMVEKILESFEKICLSEYTTVEEYEFEREERLEREAIEEQLRLEEERRRQEEEEKRRQEEEEQRRQQEEEWAQKEQEKAEQEEGSDFGKIEDLLPGDETKDPVEDDTPVDPDPVPEEELPKKEEDGDDFGKIEDLLPEEEKK